MRITQQLRDGATALMLSASASLTLYLLFFTLQKSCALFAEKTEQQEMALEMYKYIKAFSLQVSQISSATLFILLLALSAQAEPQKKNSSLTTEEGEAAKEKERGLDTRRTATHPTNKKPIKTAEEPRKQQQQDTKAEKRHLGSPGLKKRKPLRASKTPFKAIKEAVSEKTDAEAEAEAEAEKRFLRTRIEAKKQGLDLNTQLTGTEPIKELTAIQQSLLQAAKDHPKLSDTITQRETEILNITIEMALPSEETKLREYITLLHMFPNASKEKDQKITQAKEALNHIREERTAGIAKKNRNRNRQKQEKKRLKLDSVAESIRELQSRLPKRPLTKNHAETKPTANPDDSAKQSPPHHDSPEQKTRSELARQRRQNAKQRKSTQALIAKHTAGMRSPKTSRQQQKIHRDGDDFRFSVPKHKDPQDTRSKDRSAEARINNACQAIRYILPDVPPDQYIISLYLTGSQVEKPCITADIDFRVVVESDDTTKLPEYTNNLDIFLASTMHEHSTLSTTSTPLHIFIDGKECILYSLRLKEPEHAEDSEIDLFITPNTIDLEYGPYATNGHPSKIKIDRQQSAIPVAIPPSPIGLSNGDNIYYWKNCQGKQASPANSSEKATLVKALLRHPGSHFKPDEKTRYTLEEYLTHEYDTKHHFEQLKQQCYLKLGDEETYALNKLIASIKDQADSRTRAASP